jgi:septal ring factor EnvC (AmiA/AmiB activator)
MEEIKKANRKKYLKETKDKRMVIKINNMSQLFKNLDEEQIKTLKEQINQKKIDKYWKKNGGDESSNNNNVEKKEDDKKKIFKKLKFMSKKYLEIVQKKQNFNKKMEYAKNVRNNSHKKEIEINGLYRTDLPIIPLFDQNKKKALLNIIPEKEIQKYEKRYEYINNEKDNLIRKYNMETKQLKTEENILSRNSESFSGQLNDSKNESILLDIKISEQEKQLVDLKNKLSKLKDYLQKTKNKVSNIEKENGELLNELHRLTNEEDKEEEKENNEGEDKQMVENGEEDVDNSDGEKEEEKEDQNLGEEDEN